MNWKLKAHLLAILSRVPAGRVLYHQLQQLAGTNRLQLERDLNRAFELVELIHQSHQSLDGRDVLEVGTGWRPIVPFVCLLAGARRVVTIDVNPWMTLNYARESWMALDSQLELIAAECRIPLAEVQRNYSRLTNLAQDARSLDDFLRPMGIEYIYPGDARVTGLPEGSVDFVLSSNVLEHIPLDIQTEIHLESKRILKDNGLAVHRFNPQDHYSTVDSKITNGNFLQFSADSWNWYGGSGLAYHNRLRARDYREMFEKAGYSLEVCRERVDEKTLKAINSGELKVHQEFNAYSPEELSVDYMWVAARKAPVAQANSAQNSGQQSFSRSENQSV